MTRPVGKPVRTRSLAALHAGKKALGWDVETYRDFLMQMTGKSSSAELDDHELGRALDAMRARGFKRLGADSRDPAPADNPAAPQLAKIQELWTALGDGGVLHDASETALRAFGRRVTGITAPEFMTVQQRIKLIEALKAWHAREFADAVRPSTARRPID